MPLYVFWVCVVLTAALLVAAVVVENREQRRSPLQQSPLPAVLLIGAMLSIMTPIVWRTVELGLFKLRT